MCKDPVSPYYFGGVWLALWQYHFVVRIKHGTISEVIARRIAKKLWVRIHYTKGPASFDTRQNIQRCSGSSFLDNKGGGDQYLAETFYLIFFYLNFFSDLPTLWLCSKLQVGFQMLGSGKPHIISILMLPPCDTVVQHALYKYGNCPSSVLR